MKQLTSDGHFLHSPLLDPGSSGRSSASLYTQFSRPSNENVYRILDSLAPPPQDDTDSVQAVNEEDVFFPLVPKTPVEHFSGSDYRNSSEPFLLSSPQASDNIWIDLGAPSVTMQQIQTTTPRFPRARARARAKICLSPSPYMSHAFKANPKRTNHHPEPRQESPPTPHRRHRRRKSLGRCAPPQQNDDSSIEGNAKELRDPREENENWEGTGKQPLRNSIMRPPSIADIWPPPGFFPDTFGVEEGRGS
ncbi:predicted protein [Histoplasma mississippiense (nom. inval.)]|uniref:predicted protein n=1 Tax=Ajellomyces capsulatus (strain NAm1 / WU24) TaxID=2059318 RepID=UPI000157B9DD|nr:predicted protein [Histoplasma mississippiense (nom. inval.)]EDN04037.1 predicted protein [Histoplasma mississippiense (nom. inval.)]